MVKNIPQKKEALIIYTDKKGKVELRADTDKETIWATQAQIADLFETTLQNTNLHLLNIYKEAELKKSSTIKKSLIVQNEGNRSVKRNIDLYNLDAIIAVGYRINSKKATQFRIWANQVLKEYLIKGVAINRHRIEELPDKILGDLDEKIAFIQRTLLKRTLNKTEADSLLSVIHDYANAWKILKEYDEGGLVLKRGKEKERQKLEYEFLRPLIDSLREDLIKKDDASELFGSERDQSFQGILRTIYQTFDGKELYGSLTEKAAHLLYFIIKDHPFSDGNKRIGSFVFILFLEANGILRKRNGENKINDNTLVALALLIAESDPKEKETMVALTTNLLV